MLLNLKGINMQPLRFDILDESTSNFFRNMLWGMWINNEYMSGELTCGACAGKNVVKLRSKDNEVKCPCCGVMNVVEWACGETANTLV